jgi:hypothetical protein
MLLLAAAACEKRVASDLNLGQTASVDGLQVTVDQVELTDVAGGPVVGSTPQAGTRYLWVHLTARNEGDAPIDQAIKLELEYNGKRVGGVIGVFYGTDHPALDPALRLFPGITGAGWRLFEVPADVDLSKVSAVFQLGVVGARTASWTLGGSVLGQ